MTYFTVGIILFFLFLIAVFAWALASRQRFLSRAAAAAFALSCCIALPLPGMHAAMPAASSDYTAAGTTGRILAPNIKYRPLMAGEWIAMKGKRANASGLSVSSISVSNTALAAAGIDPDVIESLFQLPYDVPESLYTLENGATDPHAVMKVLAQWIEWSGEDWTQGQTVMGVGAIAPDGKVLMVDGIEAYAKAASKAKPKVFFVPVEAYETVRAIDKELLVVPITSFKEVLYFLEQPVTFWPLRNFALFCH